MDGGISRRRFLGTAAIGGTFLAGGLSGAGEEGKDPGPVGGDPPGPRPVRIHKVYAGLRGQAWPKPEVDLAAEVAGFEKVLAGVEKRLGGVELVGGDLVQTEEEAARVVARLEDADGVLLFHLSLGTGGLLAQVVNSGKPTVIFSQPFSGHEWIEIRQWQKAGKTIALFATSDRGELEQAVALLRVPALLKQSKVVLVGRGGFRTYPGEEIKERLGVDVIPVTVEEVIKAHRAADPKAAEADADAWIRKAKKVLEPTRDEIIKSSRMYLAMKKILAERGAQAITIDCLGGIPIDVLGYPCMGFTRLNDEGLVGACEADMESTLTMLLFGHAFGVPGFITDPLFDTSKNAVIHAHCVSPTKMDGPAGEQAPYLIRNHRDDNRGASLEVEMRVGQVITCAKLINLDTVLISKGKIIEITDFDDRGCRTQITTEVSDAQKMLDNWSNGLHRVVFYGDRLRAIQRLAYLMGLKVVEEA